MRSALLKEAQLAWLRREFASIEANVHDARSKPPRHVLDYVIAGACSPKATAAARCAAATASKCQRGS